METWGNGITVRLVRKAVRKECLLRKPDHQTVKGCNNSRPKTTLHLSVGMKRQHSALNIIHHALDFHILEETAVGFCSVKSRSTLNWQRAVTWCLGVLPQTWEEEMDSILVSYTDGVLNIDRADVGREKESKGGRERAFLYSFICWRKINCLPCITQFWRVGTSVWGTALWQKSRYHVHSHAVVSRCADRHIGIYCIGTV